jgi:hypothetical protein
VSKDRARLLLEGTDAHVMILCDSAEAAGSCTALGGEALHDLDDCQDSAGRERTGRPGDRPNIASVLLLGVDPIDCPGFRSTRRRKDVS